jgi:hypothetical protein
MRRALACGVTLLCLCFGPASRAEPTCPAPVLEPAAAKEQLRRWSGLAPFAQWRLLEVKLPACGEGDRLLASLWLAPPERWSSLRLPYRLRLELQLEARQGTPPTKAPEAWRDWPALLKRLMERLEADEDVVRFVRRHRVVQVELRPGETPESSEAWVLTDPGPRVAAERGAALTFRAAGRGAVVAYRLPRMDAWPARRELLRFVEVLSQHHPDCRPSWIEALASSAPGDKAPVTVWSLFAELEGRGCPAAFRAQLAPEGVAAEFAESGGSPGAKGE